jgi:hypothetical protein
MTHNCLISRQHQIIEKIINFINNLIAPKSGKKKLHEHTIGIFGEKINVLLKTTYHQMGQFIDKL